MKRIYWTVGDKANRDRFLPGLEKSFRRFHPDDEFRVYNGEEYVERLGDPNLKTFLTDWA